MNEINSKSQRQNGYFPEKYIKHKISQYKTYLHSVRYTIASSYIQKSITIEKENN